MELLNIRKKIVEFKRLLFISKNIFDNSKSKTKKIHRILHVSMRVLYYTEL